jgi:hypothetical protein
LYAVIIVGVLAVLGVVAAIAAIAFLGDEVTDTIDEAIDDDPCPFLTNSQAADLFGSGARTFQMTGFNEFYELTVDTRVLESAPDCVVVLDDSAVARVARHQGSDASTVFASEKDVADGTSEDRGGGLSVETEAYINEDQPVDVGDEGFCTTSSLIGGSGVLVRQGDTLVYVGVQPDFTSQAPDVNLEEGELGTDDTNCTKAQEVAREVLD